jgi:hypothetical protein
MMCSASAVRERTNAPEHVLQFTAMVSAGETESGQGQKWDEMPVRLIYNLGSGDSRASLNVE